MKTHTSELRPHPRLSFSCLGCERFLLERADRRQHSQQSLAHSQAQSVSSLTSDLWDRSSAETPGISSSSRVLSQGDARRL